MANWTVRDEFRLSIRLGLKKGLALVRGMRRALTEDEQERVVAQIDGQLQKGWTIRRVEPSSGPGLHSKLTRGRPEESA